MNNENPQNEQQVAPHPIYQQPATDQGRGLCLAGLVCGILSFILVWSGILAFILGIVGIICASKGTAKARLAGAPIGLGTAGEVISIIGTCISGIIVFFFMSIIIFSLIMSFTTPDALIFIL